MTRLKTEQYIYARFAEDRLQNLKVEVYVGDLIIAGSSRAMIDKIKQQLLRRVQYKDLRAQDRILNMEITRTESGLQIMMLTSIIESVRQSSIQRVYPSRRVRRFTMSDPSLLILLLLGAVAMHY